MYMNGNVVRIYKYIHYNICRTMSCELMNDFLIDEFDN